MGTTNLKVLAERAMHERGLDPGYARDARDQVEATAGPATDAHAVDLTALPWCSIDNGEGEIVSSRDLDQLTVAQEHGPGVIKISVAIADVDALVPKGSPVDRQASRNTTTVYCADMTYPMIDTRFSEGLTSLNEGEDRLAIVTELHFADNGDVEDFRIYRALVRNHVKLNYEGTGDWLAGNRPSPVALEALPEVQASIVLQDKVAQRYKQWRRRRGSLTLESLEARARMEGGQVLDIRGQLCNRATELIENLMVACNGCSSRYLRSQGLPTFQRIVRQPKFWSRIVEVAQSKHAQLPQEPDSKALEAFLERQRKDDPVHFPDLSLEILKLLGRGEYCVEEAQQLPVGHFGLAVREYTHSTAPNRRYPDLITQRLIKAALAGDACPYDLAELDELARHCSEQEARAQKVERRTHKSAAAALLSNQIGHAFDVVVSGQNDQGTWVRLRDRPIEGKLRGSARMGQQLTVKLVGVDVEKGFIDFQQAKH